MSYKKRLLNLLGLSVGDNLNVDILTFSKPKELKYSPSSINTQVSITSPLSFNECKYHRTDISEIVTFTELALFKTKNNKDLLCRYLNETFDLGITRNDFVIEGKVLKMSPECYFYVGEVALKATADVMLFKASLQQYARIKMYSDIDDIISLVHYLRTDIDDKNTLPFDMLIKPFSYSSTEDTTTLSLDDGSKIIIKLEL